MAVTGGNTETVQTVLTIDTSKSASSMKELREQVKALKDQLVGLDKGTQEYSDTLVQLGEKMHEMKEINEEIRRTNSDFGDTLGNVSNVMAGGVAAVQGLTAGLSLLGVQMGDDNKLTQTLVKSMALLQSLGTMEKAIKSFKALSVVIKANITAAGGLGKALKALAVSNPFTAILAAATALVGVLVMVKNKNDEAAEAAKEAAAAERDRIQQLNDILAGLAGSADDVQARFQFDKAGIDKLTNSTSALWREVQSLAGEIQRTEPDKKYIAWAEAFKRSYEEAIRTGDRYKAMLLEITEQQWVASRANQSTAEGLEKYTQAMQKAANIYANYIKSRQKGTKVEKDLEKEKYDLALKRLNLQKTLDDTELQARYEEEKRMAQGNAEVLLAIEEKYQNDRKILNERYYKDAIALAENFKKTRKSEADIVALDQTIANLNQSLQEGADAWENYKIENAAANIELERTKIDAQATLDGLNRQTAAMEREIEITQAHNERYLELIKQKWTLQADLDAEAIRYQQEQLQNANVGIDNELDALRTRHDAEMTLLQEQYDAKLIAEEEFQQKKAELEANYNNESMSLLQQHFENEAALDELAVEAKKNEVERKKELQEMYMSAISSITGSITAVLNEAANAEDISFEDQKKLKIASTIITTLTSAMEAFQSVASIPIVGPALGAAAAASTIAVGMMQVNKIRQTKKNSSNASVSTGAIQTVQTPTQMTNITGFSDNIELPDQRVYVLESDITNAQNHVQVVENNSSF